MWEVRLTGQEKQTKLARKCVFVLGGTAGCVVAARLADAYTIYTSSLSIEGRGSNQIPAIEYPAYFMFHLAPDVKTHVFYRTKKSPGVADRMLVLPTGGVLGGGSSTDMMMYIRAQRSD